MITGVLLATSLFADLNSRGTLAAGVSQVLNSQVTLVGTVSQGKITAGAVHRVWHDRLGIGFDIGSSYGGKLVTKYGLSYRRFPLVSRFSIGPYLKQTVTAGRGSWSLGFKVYCKMAE